MWALESDRPEFWFWLSSGFAREFRYTVVGWPRDWNPGTWL